MTCKWCKSQVAAMNLLREQMLERGMSKKLNPKPVSAECTACGVTWTADARGILHADEKAIERPERPLPGS